MTFELQRARRTTTIHKADLSIDRHRRHASKLLALGQDLQCFLLILLIILCIIGLGAGHRLDCHSAALYAGGLRLSLTVAKLGLPGTEEATSKPEAPTKRPRVGEPEAWRSEPLLQVHLFCWLASESPAQTATRKLKTRMNCAYSSPSF